MEQAGLLIPEQDWRRLLAAASPDAALLYLYLRTGGDRAQAPIALRMPQSRLDCAAAALKQMGLWQEAPKVIRPAEPPMYSEQDLITQMQHDSGFPQLVGEAQRRLGKILSNEELKVLLSLYDYLGMGTDVISILIAYCIQRARAKGKLRTPSLHTIEKEAYHWADLGIDTMEEAAAYMQLQLERQTRAGQIRAVLQLGDRKLTPGEEKFILQWLDWGFGAPEIGKAYEKTCLNTGGLKWPYLNSILRSWHQQGLHTVQDIERGDKAPGKPGRPMQGEQPLGDLERDAIKRMMQKQEE